MKYLTIDEVIAIHDDLIIAFGGSLGIRDFNLLHSAVSRSTVTFSSVDLYTSVFDKAAALLDSLILNHAFIDGNKRTAYVSCARFLYINGYTLNLEQQEIVKFVLKVEKEKTGIREISKILKENTKKIKFN